MTTQFLIAFGGPLVLCAFGSIVIAIVTRPLKGPRVTIDDPRKMDIDASLAEAQVAARLVESEIAKVRARIAL